MRLFKRAREPRLVYAATSRCPCGLGIAHLSDAQPYGDTAYWDCAGILLGTADETVKHTAKLPFMFYEIKSEKQPSANGATTRPQATEELAGGGPCARCGRNPALGYAQINDDWYCHPDNGPSCYDGSQATEEATR